MKSMIKTETNKTDGLKHSGSFSSSAHVFPRSTVSYCLPHLEFLNPVFHCNNLTPFLNLESPCWVAQNKPQYLLNWHMDLEHSYGVFPPLPLPFFRVQIRATAAGSEKVSLLGRQSRAAVDGGTRQEAAPHSAPPHALLPCVRPREELLSLALVGLLPCRQKYEASYAANSLLQAFISRG